MRISDWSSDVCSSDLLRAAATAFAFVPRIDADFFSSYFKGLHLDVESRGMVAMGWTAPVGHDRLHELETVMRSEGDDDFFAWPVTSEKQIYPVLYLERSEEHTSELQSLMRISYAVFCLKKTIQTH